MCSIPAVEPLQPFSSDDEQTPDQLREVKAARNVATLADCAKKMLKIQVEVSEGTKRLATVVQDRPDKKLHPEDHRVALNLSGKQNGIVVEATKAIAIIKAEGSATAFANAVQLLRADMILIQRRLANSDIGSATLDGQQEIIDTLQEMIESLKSR